MRAAGWALIGLLGVPAAARAACPANSKTIDADLAGAVTAFQSMDPAAFGAAKDAAKADLACLDEPIAPATAAQWYRVEALDGYLRRQPAATIGAFRSALAVEPDWTLPAAIAPAGNPLAHLFDQAKASPAGPTEPLGDGVVVDGVAAQARPTDRPAIVQHVVGGKVDATVELAAGDALPDWAKPAPAVATTPATSAGTTSAGTTSVATTSSGTTVAATTSTSSTALPTKPAEPTAASHGHTGRAVFVTAAGATAVASATLYALALGTRSTFDDPATPYEDLDGLQHKANGLGYAAQGGAVVAVGLGVAAVVVPF